MEVDKTGASESAAAQRIAQKKQQQEIEEQRVQLEIARTQRERQKAVEAEKEKGDREVVEISRQATTQMDNARRMNTERVKALSENQQKSYDALAAKTAEELKVSDANAKKALDAHKFGTMERIKNITDRGEDPFYHMKSLEPVLSENEAAYTVQVKLPEHEAKNLFVSGEGPYLKLSLARRFQDSAKGEAGRNTTTNSYQSVVEQIAMPGAYDAKKIERSYENGLVTLKVPKLKFGAPDKPGKA